MLISEYIDLFERELFESCAPFWVKYGFDHENGGITTCLDREGKVYSTDKSVWMQGRCGYMYSRLHNVFPDRDPGECKERHRFCYRTLYRYRRQNVLPGDCRRQTPKETPLYVFRNFLYHSLRRIL